MNKSIVLLIVFLHNETYACLPVIANNTEPPRLINGKWVESKAVSPKITKIDYKDLFQKYSIVFSAEVEQAYNENNQVSDFMYTHEIWKGNVLKNFELTGINSSFAVNMTCNSGIQYGIKYVFFAEMGIRKTPIRLMKAVIDNPDIRKYLKKPIKTWINGRVVK